MTSSTGSPAPRRPASSAGSAQPSRTRYWVIVFAVTLAIITYIDRVCISQAKSEISTDFNLDTRQMGYVFSAFTLAYALFEIPTGWLGDWKGPRLILTRVVVWWSFFTAATGAAWNFGSLVVIRFLFGAGEAGCFPNLTKVFSTWLPADERVRAQGITWMSARWGGAFTPLLVVWVLSYMSWRKAFVLFGLLGMVWAVFFYRWFRNDPRDHPGVNAGEQTLLAEAAENAEGHANVPWKKLISSRTVLLLWVQYFCLAYGWYFYITWLPTYLKDGRGLTGKTQAVLAGFPLLFGGVGCVVGGILAARLAAAYANTAKARRIIGFTGFIGAAVLTLLAGWLGDPVVAMIAMGLASLFNDLTMPGSWGACMDVGGRYAGTLSGSMNMMGNLGGAVAGVADGFILQAYPGGWSYIFMANAVIYVLGAFCWFFIDPVTPLEKQGAARSAA
jgi:MFS transporter, ACS family, glucarate transporter